MTTEGFMKIYAGDSSLKPRGGGGTPIHYLYGLYVPPNGVVILERGIHFRGVF